MPLLSEMRAKTTKVTKDREGSRAAFRSCAGGLRKHLNCALAPLVSAELKILRKDLEGCQDNSVSKTAMFRFGWGRGTCSSYSAASGATRQRERPCGRQCPAGPDMALTKFYYSFYSAQTTCFSLGPNCKRKYIHIKQKYQSSVNVCLAVCIQVTNTQTVYFRKKLFYEIVIRSQIMRDTPYSQPRFRPTHPQKANKQAPVN